MSLSKPPTIDDKALAALDSEWRTAKEIHSIIGEDAPVTARAALSRLAASGTIERRYELRPYGLIAFYRRKIEASGEMPKHLELL